MGKNNKQSTCKIHQLVAKAFIENPQNKRCVDHINTVRTDNNINNLRFATHSENAINTKIYSTNTSGSKGVSFHKIRQQWRAYITVDRNRLYLGYFDTKEEAIQARKEKANTIFGEFTHESEKMQTIQIKTPIKNKVKRVTVEFE